MNEIQPTNNLRTIPRPTDTLEHRVSNMEKHNQIRRIESTDGLTYFDTETGEIVMKNGSIDSGTITGADIVGAIITGGVIKTANTGLRIEMADNRISIYDTGDIERQRLGGASVAYWDEAGRYGGSIYSAYYVPWSVPIIHINAYTRIDDDCTVAGVLQCEDDLVVLGAKDFNIPHPTKKGKRLVYSCIESPEVLVMCRGKKGDKIPQHFTDVSEPGTLDIITGVDGNWFATAVRMGYLNREVEPDDNPAKDLNPRHLERQRKSSDLDSGQLENQDVIPVKESKVKPKQPKKP